MSTVPTNPADCDRTTVYTGECRNFADTEWIRFDSGRRRSPDARDGNTWLIDVAYGSFWMADDKVRNIVPLVPGRDFSGVDWKTMYDHARSERDAAVYACDKAECEREKWKARAESAERDRDEWRDKAYSASEGMRKAVARAEAAEARTTPAVTKADIEQAIRPKFEQWQSQLEIPVDFAINAVCDLLAIEAEQAVDPVEAKAQELYEHVYTGRFEDGSSGVQAEYRKLAAYLLGQEGCHVDR